MNDLRLFVTRGSVFLVSLLLLAPVSAGLESDESERRSTVMTPYFECLMAQQDLEAFFAEHPESDDEALIARVSRIGQRIVPMSDRPFFHYDFRVFRSEEIDAHSFSGGAVVISEEAVRFHVDDDELAFIIAHEIAHLAMRDRIRRMRRITAETFAPEGGRRADRREEAKERDIGWEDEREIDRYGALYAFRAGYRYSASYEAFERVVREHPERAAGDDRHPPLDERIEALRSLRTELERAVEHFRRGLEAHRAGRSDDALRHLQIFCNEFPQSIAGNVNLGAIYLSRLRSSGVPEGLAEPLPILPDPGVSIRGGRPSRKDLEGARASFERALSKADPIDEDPGYAMTLTGLGMVHLWERRLIGAEGALGRATAYFEKALEIEPDSVEVILCLGNAAYLANDWAKAERRFREALRIEPGSPEATKNLALAIAQAGRPCEARPLWESLRGSTYGAEAASRLDEIERACSS